MCCEGEGARQYGMEFRCHFAHSVEELSLEDQNNYVHNTCLAEEDPRHARVAKAECMSNWLHVCEHVW